jgi:hypothetical protein
MLFSPKARSISSRYVSLYGALILYDVGEARGGGQPAGGGGQQEGGGGRRTTNGGGGERPVIGETDI